ncbi:MAG: late competence development ComFB family protein [Bacillota bacterium]
MRLINVAEIVVFDILDRLLPKKDVCKCERCRMDIAAIALNNVPPNYVVSTEGKVRRSINRQLKVDVGRQVEDAIEKVKEHPHHKQV